MITHLILIKFLVIASFNIDISNNRLIYIKNEVFEVWYNEVYEQPIKLIYKSTNKSKKISRSKFNFYKPENINTSDDKDYYKNIWDKGHLAPAASFSDTKENLRTTFSYLNCALQNQYLNRGLWKVLENKEREWDDLEDLTITIEICFNDIHQVLNSGAHVPDFFIKHIFFEKKNIWKCYMFTNTKPFKKLNACEIEDYH